MKCRSLVRGTGLDSCSESSGLTATGFKDLAKLDHGIKEDCVMLPYWQCAEPLYPITLSNSQLKVTYDEMITCPSDSQCLVQSGACLRPSPWNEIGCGLKLLTHMLGCGFYIKGAMQAVDVAICIATI